MLPWSCLGMQPDFALALFREVDKFPAEAPFGSVLLDLSDNQLGTMGEEELLELLRVIQRHDWLVVRFGSEVNAVALGRAVDQLGLGLNRVHIDMPWRNAELSALGVSLRVTTDAVATPESRVRAQSPQPSLLRTQRPTPRASHPPGYRRWPQAWRDASRTAMSLRPTTSGKAARLLPGHLATYLDCMVVGRLPGGEQRVVVLGEAKLNLQKNWVEALNQVLLNVGHWDALCQLVGDPSQGEEPTTGDLKDIERLGVRELADLPVCLALGGASVPGPLVELISKCLRKIGLRDYWFCVQMEGGEAKVVHL